MKFWSRRSRGLTKIATFTVIIRNMTHQLKEPNTLSVDRRHFLRSAAAMIALPALESLPVLGAAGTATAAPKPLNHEIPTP